MDDARKLLLLGNYRPSVSLVRQLSKAGYSVVVTREEGGLAALSRHAHEVWEHESPLASTSFIAELAAFLSRRPDIAYVVPVQECCVLSVARHRDALPADRVYVTPAPDVVEQCLNKIGMLAVVDKLGIPSAQAQVVRDFDALQSAVAKIGSPVIVRPASSSLPIEGRKALILRDADKLGSYLTGWPRGHDVLIAQRFVDGPRYNVDFAAQDGRVVRAVATHVRRTNAYDGTGIDVCGVTVPMPDDLLEYTRRLAAEMRYTGVGLAQYMVDRERDEITFLELNPRYNGNHAVTEAAGLGIAALTVAMSEGHIERETIISKGGLRHAWTYGDLLGVFQSYRRGMLSASQMPRRVWIALCDGLTADHHIMWNWRDPLPGISQFLTPVRRAWSQRAAIRGDLGAKLRRPQERRP